MLSIIPAQNMHGFEIILTKLGQSQHNKQGEQTKVQNAQHGISCMSKTLSEQQVVLQKSPKK